MSFDNLPPDWPMRSLADPRLAADVVDLFLGIGDRLRDSALLIFCDDEGRAIQPAVIDGVDWYGTAAERAALFCTTCLAHGLEVPGVVVAVSAASPIEPEVVERWRLSAQEELARGGVDLLGFFTADPGGVSWPLPRVT